MKPRRWVIVVAVIALIIGSIACGGIALLEKNGDIKRLLVRAISTSTGNDFSVGRVKIGFLSVYLENVTITLRSHFYRLDIRDIKVGFSLKNLIWSKGDVGRSISKMILIHPQLSIFTDSRASDQGEAVGPARTNIDLFAAIRHLPVDQFLVRAGTVCIFDKGREGFTIGEELAGSIKAQPQGIAFDVHGAIAGRRKNLYLSGLLSNIDRRTRISVRIDKARLKKPVRWNAIELRSGVLDGVCELSLPDFATSSTVDAGGWIRLRDATAAFNGVEAPLTGVTVSVTLLNGECKIDSIKADWKGISCLGAGNWSLASGEDGFGNVVMQCRGIRPKSLFPKAGKTILDAVHGDGWAVLRYVKKRASAGGEFSVTAGAMSIGGVALDMSAKGKLERNQCTIDSCAVLGAAVRAEGAGIINYEKSPPAYTFTYSLKADSLPRISALRGSGRFSVRGSLHGLGPKVHFEATLSGRRTRLNDIAFGDPELSISGEDVNHILFRSARDSAAFFNVSGSIDGFPEKTPLVSAAVSVGPRMLQNALTLGFPAIGRAVEFTRASGYISGNFDEFEASGQAGLLSPFVRGSLQYTLSKQKNNTSIDFRVSQRDLYAGDSAIAFMAMGSIAKNGLHVDSFSVMNALRGSGHFNGASGGALNVSIQCRDLPIGAVNMFFGNALPIKRGSISGISRIYGTHGRIYSESQLHLRGCSFAAMEGLDADFIVMSKDTEVIVLPTTVRKEGTPFISLDTLHNVPGIRCSGRIESVRLKTLLEGSIPEEYTSGDNEIKGTLSGVFYSEKSGLPIHVHLTCPSISMNSWHLDSMQTDVDIEERRIVVKKLTVSDSTRLRLLGSGSVPWAVIGGHGDSSGDTMDVRIKAQGDLLASFEKNISIPFNLPVAGSAMGAMELQFRGTAGAVRLYGISGTIPRGSLRVKPYLQRTVNDFSCMITMEGDASGSDIETVLAVSQVRIDINGTIDKRPIRIYSSHKIPEGLEPLRLGFLDAGVIHIITPRHGVDLHLPGLMEPGVTGEVEFASKAPLPAFTLSGPIDHMRVSGTWIVHNGEFTFPPLKNGETAVAFDPFPSITWDLDVKAVNRKVKYYYDAGTKNHRLMRLVECYVDPVSIVSLRGRDNDNTFKILGALRSYKGSVFFRKVFDQSFEAGLDFLPQPLSNGKGFDNMPIIWGSAEALSDKNRFERTKLTLITRDSVTGALSEKGRFYDIRFRVSSDAEEAPGESEKAFLTTEGKRVASIEGASELVSTLGEQYVHRFLLQNLEGRLAKSLGLDVITFETSIASNYFNKIYNRQLVNLANDWSYLAFANVGITFGRYILYDKVFLKWRTELVPVDTLIKPEYTMGFEFQPLSYFMMDFDYGVRPGEKFLEQNPKVYLQLRLPIEHIRNYFKF